MLAPRAGGCKRRWLPELGSGGGASRRWEALEVQVTSGTLSGESWFEAWPSAPLPAPRALSESGQNAREAHGRSSETQAVRAGIWTGRARARVADVGVVALKPA